MIYIAHVEVYDDFDNKNAIYKLVLDAENWSEAMDKLVNHFGEDEIEAIKLLEPITDNCVVHIDEIAEAHIREQKFNGF